MIKKIRKTLKALFLIIRNPWLLNNILNNDQHWQSYINKKYPLKKRLRSIDLTDLGFAENEQIETYAFLDGSSLPTDIALLQIIARSFENCKYFEIGTWRGESVVNVANYADICYTFNLSEKEIIEKGLNVKYAQLHGFFSKNNPKIKHIFGNTKTFNLSNLNLKFDLIFIDGDHSYEMVKNDTEKVFKTLVHDNTIVVWHDYARNPETIRPEVLAGILDGLHPSQHDNLYHVSNTLCAIYTKKRYNSKEYSPPITPDKSFTINLKVTPIKHSR